MADQNGTLRYEAGEPSPLLTTILTAFQITVILVALVVVPVVIIVRTAEQPEAYLTWTVFASLAICGLTTILQALRIGRFGAGHILVMGTSEPAIAICLTALVDGGPSMMASLVVISSFLKFVVAARLSMLRRFITPTVSGLLLMLIASTVIFAVFHLLTEVPESASTTSAPVAAATTMFVIVALMLRAPKPLQPWSPIIGIIVGCIVAALFGLIETEQIREAGWFGFPDPEAWPGFGFQPVAHFLALLPEFVIITLIVSFKAVADTVVIQRVSQRQPRASDFRTVQGALNVDGIGNLLCGIAGTIPNMTVSPTAAIVNLTGVAARRVGIFAGIMFIGLALLPKITAILLAIPAPVAAAYLMVMMGLVFAEGVETIARDGIGHRKAIVLAISFWIGIGFQEHLIFAHLLKGPWEALLGNTVTSGSIVAGILIAFIELTSPRRSRLEVDLDISSLPEIDGFLREFASKRDWNEISNYRLRSAGEETLLVMLQYEEPDKQRLLVISVRIEDDEAELEFLSGYDENNNLEDNLAYLTEQVEVMDESEISFRLLRHYASSVHHQKYHNIDVITVRVEAQS